MSDLLRCRVRLRLLHASYCFREIEAKPHDDVPDPRMLIEAWHGDHWRFSTVFGNVPGTVNTVPFGLLDNLDPVCDLTYSDGTGFRFQAADFSELRHGDGI